MNTLFPKYSHRKEGNLTIMEQRLLKQVNHLVFDLDNCTGCGICVDACPEEAIVLGPVGAVRRGAIQYGEAVSVDEKKCSYCGVCVVMCPFNAMSLRIDGEEKLPIIEREGFPTYDPVRAIDDEKCILCTTCKDVCPRTPEKAILRDVPAFEGTDAAGLKKAEAIHANITFDCDEEKCTVCGLCGDVCAALTVKKKPFSPEIGKVRGEVKWTQKLCDGCGVCSEICPSDAITVTREEAVQEKRGKVSITGDCITCRWCAVNCPTEAITVEKLFEGDIEFHTEKCPGGCSTCVEICPANAIYLPSPKNPADMHGEVEAKIGVNKDFCILCGVCVNACPGEDIIVLKRTGIRMKGKETDLFKTIKDKLLRPRTSKVREGDFGKVELKTAE
ncbi:4Fe-4S ferredoxin iron-sulfur binding domain protein [Methanolacinia petrolearia DSM 11571]|uniref:4Fe-4S ferredoxin iron-sulfur binding domain protein n=1 Tax=Methanolacinia petrolearia (strain DSM 11571 / OCM 486 / SEBR 4847) TaxID=679926 RepID=E1REI1_METP4|nr:4Fe-4S binding protein [Methanolacinia petrolearia]ADN37224.1 4Fe-4S ferredoxin iron-sulfur binding domain protein [Methanolacinia petrolearia DSM 11571]